MSCENNNIDRFDASIFHNQEGVNWF